MSDTDSASGPRVILGLDFGGTKIAAAVCDAGGRRLADTVVDNLGHLGAQASFDHGIRTARRLLAETAPDAALVAVGVSTFGIPYEDRVDLAPAIDGWTELALGRELRAAFTGVGVRMTTDAKAAAYAEARWGSLAGRDPAVYVNLGTGLAAAAVINGRVLAGSHGAAGEIGYNLRFPGDVGLGTDQRVTLEEMVSGLALQRRASATGRQLTAAEVFAAGRHELGLDELISAFIEELAFHLVNLAILVDPERIAVGGGMARSWDRIEPRLAAALNNGVPFPPELVLARYAQDAPLIGAIALAVDAATAESTAGADEVAASTADGDVMTEEISVITLKG